MKRIPDSQLLLNNVKIEVSPAPRIGEQFVQETIEFIESDNDYFDGFKMKDQLSKLFRQFKESDLFKEIILDVFEDKRICEIKENTLEVKILDFHHEIKNKFVALMCYHYEELRVDLGVDRTYMGNQFGSWLNDCANETLIQANEPKNPQEKLNEVCKTEIEPNGEN